MKRKLVGQLITLIISWMTGNTVAYLHFHSFTANFEAAKISGLRPPIANGYIASYVQGGPIQQLIISVLSI